MADKKNSNQTSGTTQQTQGNGSAKGTAANQNAGKSQSVNSSKPTISKMDAVRKAMSSMGRDAKPTEIQTYIKSKFGIEMTKDHISNYKGDIARKEAESATGSATPQAATATKKPAAPKAPTPAPTPKPASDGKQPRAAGGSSILLEDVLTAKVLLDRVGADKLRTLIDGLTK